MPRRPRFLFALSLVIAVVAQVAATCRSATASGRDPPAAAGMDTSHSQPKSRSKPQPLHIENAQLEPIDFADLDNWGADDHASAFAAFLSSCRPIVRRAAADRERLQAKPKPVGREKRDEERPDSVRAALASVCRRALAAGILSADEARIFFERNFRPLRITKLGEGAGFLTGYYEPVVDGSRFPTGIFKVPLHRRPPDLIAPGTPPGRPLPNRGRMVRVTRTGDHVPYYDRGEIEDGALDGQRLEICWLKNWSDAFTIQIQGSAQIRLEDGTMLRVNYDGFNGYPYTAIGRVLIDRNIIPREEMSMARIGEWMTAHPEEAKEVRRHNRSYVFFRVIGLTDEKGPLGGQGIPLMAGRSIAVDRRLHAYGTPFFIEAELPLTGPRSADPFRRTMIAQDTGSAIVGPARADLYFGAGNDAGRIAGRIRQAGRFAMLVPREIDPVAAGAHMPLPRARPASQSEEPANALHRGRNSSATPPSQELRRSRPEQSAH